MNVIIDNTECFQNKENIRKPHTLAHMLVSKINYRPHKENSLSTVTARIIFEKGHLEMNISIFLFLSFWQKLDLFRHRFR